MNKIANLTNPLARKSIRSVSLAKLGGDLSCKPQAWPKPDYGPTEVHKSEFLNGMKVAAGKPLGHRIAACTILFQAGSRNEFGPELGVSHFLRAGSVTSGMGYSGFIKSRYLQQHGGYITCASDRQTISYTLRCPLPVFADLKCYLLDAGPRCTYPDHELTTVKTMVHEDLDRRHPAEHCLDLIQQACFAGPLSNSIYCVKERISSINSDVINEFAKTYFKTNVCTIGSYGVPFEEVLKVASHIDCGRVERPPEYCLTQSFPRGGYEYYDTGPGGDTYIALAVPGAGTCDYNCCLLHALLASACGIANVATGSHVWDRIPAAPLSHLIDDPFTDFTAFNISYFETGIWGILIKTRSKMAQYAAYRANEFMANLGTLSIDHLRAGKKRLQVGVLLNEDDCVRASEGLAMQAATGVMYDSARHMAYCIGEINETAILDAACCIAAKRNSGQLAVAVVGDVAAAPNDGELRC